MTKSTESPFDPAMRSAVMCVAICAGILGIGALLLYGFREALGVLIGGAIATANLVVFARLGRALLDPKAAKGVWFLIAMLKVVVLFGGVWLLMKHDVVSGLALAVGYGSLPLGITIGTLAAPKAPD